MADQKTFAWQQIDQDSLATFRQLANALRSIALYFGTRGSVSIRRPAGDPWADVQTALLCYSWSVRLEVRTYWASLPNQRIPAFVQLAAFPALLLLCSFVSLDDKKQEEWASEWIRALLDDRSARLDTRFAGRHFEPFLIWLYFHKYRGESVEGYGVEKIGAYRKLVDSWDDATALVEALKDACEYHCQRMIDRDAKWKAEFDYPPFDLIPFEIIATKKIRDRLGLVTSAFDHPLLVELPVQLQNRVDGEVEELIEAIRRKYRKTFVSD